ncbi:mitochondrial glutathione transporter SLC25A40 isoform 2-T2 [Cyanocitta cristata]
MRFKRKEDDGFCMLNVEDAFVKIIQIEGIKSLWSGLPPTLIMAVPTTSIYFTCYDQLCEALKNRPGKHEEHIPVIAGSLSRFGSTTVVGPLELIRIRMQYHKLSYKQLYLCVSTKVAADGWLSLWGGWTSTVLRDVPFSARVYFLCRFLLMFLYSFSVLLGNFNG